MVRSGDLNRVLGLLGYDLGERRDEVTVQRNGDSVLLVAPDLVDAHPPRHSRDTPLDALNAKSRLK